MRPIPVAGITAYVGANGSGKTALAVHERIRHAIRTGRPLYSTVDVHWRAERGKYKGKFVESVPITGWSQLSQIEGADFLLDEVAALASSRETIGLPPDLLNWLGSLRHHDVTCTWTAPSWNRADKVLREITQVIVAMRPLINDTAINELRWSLSEVPFLRVSPPTRYWARTFYAFAGVYNTMGASDGDAPLGRPGSMRVVPVSRLLSIGAYDSWAGVPHLSEHSPVCDECGNLKRREYCRGHAKSKPSTVVEDARARNLEGANV